MLCRGSADSERECPAFTIYKGNAWTLYFAFAIFLVPGVFTTVSSWQVLRIKLNNNNSQVVYSGHHLDRLSDLSFFIPIGNIYHNNVQALPFRCWVGGGRGNDFAIFQFIMFLNAPFFTLRFYDVEATWK